MKDYEVVTEKDSKGNVIKATVVAKKQESKKSTKISNNNTK